MARIGALAVTEDDGTVELTVGNLTFSLLPGEAVRLGRLLLDSGAAVARTPVGAEEET